MGFDTLELILGWESAFGVEFSDDEAIALRTPKMAIDLISDKLKASDDRLGVCPTMRLYHCIREAFQAIVGLQRQQVQLNSQLRMLLPKHRRQEAWSQIHSRVGVLTFPAFGFGVGVIFHPFTVQNLVDWVAAHYPSHFVGANERWTRSQVRSVVRAVVRDVVGVPDFNDESDFIREIRY